MKTKTTSLITLLLGLLISACNGATATPTPGPQVQAWIDAPLPNSTVPLATYQLVFHGTSFNGVDEFEVSVNGQVDGAVPPLATGSGGSQQGTLFYGEYPWMPPAPGTYLISVRAKDGQEQFGPPAEVQVQVGDVLAEVGDEPPLVQPGPTTTPELAASCTYTAVVNLFCRTGPGQVYPELDSFVPDDMADVIGISPDGSHVQVLGPNFGEACFVPIEERFGLLDGTCDDLEVVSIPPTPTPTLTPTPEPADPTSTPPPPQPTPTATCNPLNIQGAGCP
ncbi:MAG: hypothetical protein DWQ07_12370 [Chloroflexi bacterium]|nr:MAG: hypothetical protein DWQ07_12370 [Chloroflexota bacterium]MBL1196834.1 hypothetical protein [Chloroflexota bacterium]NOH14129.1 hypothetical protein [Chloroflexota bacterium]